MLPKKQRVGKKFFNQIFSTGGSFHTSSLSVKTIFGENLANFSVVAQKSASRGAVGRNKLRRQGYYVLEKHKKKLKKGNASIFFIKKEIPFLQIESEMLALLTRAKLIE